VERREKGTGTRVCIIQGEVGLGSIAKWRVSLWFTCSWWAQLHLSDATARRHCNRSATTDIPSRFECNGTFPVSTPNHLKPSTHGCVNLIPGVQLASATSTASHQGCRNERCRPEGRPWGLQEGREVARSLYSNRLQRCASQLRGKYEAKEKKKRGKLQVERSCPSVSSTSQVRRTP
jgi:hypothetical protein